MTDKVNNRLDIVDSESKILNTMTISTDEPLTNDQNISSEQPQAATNDRIKSSKVSGESQNCCARILTCNVAEQQKEHELCQRMTTLDDYCLSVMTLLKILAGETVLRNNMCTVIESQPSSCVCQDVDDALNDAYRRRQEKQLGIEERVKQIEDARHRREQLERRLEDLDKKLKINESPIKNYTDNNSQVLEKVKELEIQVENLKIQLSNCDEDVAKMTVEGRIHDLKLSDKQKIGITRKYDSNVQVKNPSWMLEPGTSSENVPTRQTSSKTSLTAKDPQSKLEYTNTAVCETNPDSQIYSEVSNQIADAARDVLTLNREYYPPMADLNDDPSVPKPEELRDASEVNASQNENSAEKDYTLVSQETNFGDTRETFSDTQPSIEVPQMIEDPKFISLMTSSPPESVIESPRGSKGNPSSNEGEPTHGETPEKSKDYEPIDRKVPEDDAKFVSLIEEMIAGNETSDNITDHTEPLLESGQQDDRQNLENTEDISEWQPPQAYSPARDDREFVSLRSRISDASKSYHEEPEVEKKSDEKIYQNMIKLNPGELRWWLNDIKEIRRTMLKCPRCKLRSDKIVQLCEVMSVHLGILFIPSDISEDEPAGQNGGENQIQRKEPSEIIKRAIPTESNRRGVPETADESASNTIPSIKTTLDNSTWHDNSFSRNMTENDDDSDYIQLPSASKNMQTGPLSTSVRRVERRQLESSESQPQDSLILPSGPPQSSSTPNKKIPELAVEYMSPRVEKSALRDGTNYATPRYQPSPAPKLPGNTNMKRGNDFTKSPQALALPEQIQHNESPVEIIPREFSPTLSMDSNSLDNTSYQQMEEPLAKRTIRHPQQQYPQQQQIFEDSGNKSSYIELPRPRPESSRPQEAEGTQSSSRGQQENIILSNPINRDIREETLGSTANAASNDESGDSSESEREESRRVSRGKNDDRSRKIDETKGRDSRGKMKNNQSNMSRGRIIEKDDDKSPSLKEMKKSPLCIAKTPCCICHAVRRFRSPIKITRSQYERSIVSQNGHSPRDCLIQSSHIRHEIIELKRQEAQSKRNHTQDVGTTTSSRYVSHNLADYSCEVCDCNPCGSSSKKNQGVMTKIIRRSPDGR